MHPAHCLTIRVEGSKKSRVQKWSQLNYPESKAFSEGAECLLQGRMSFEMKTFREMEWWSVPGFYMSYKRKWKEDWRKVERNVPAVCRATHIVREEEGRRNHAVGAPHSAGCSLLLHQWLPRLSLNFNSGHELMFIMINLTSGLPGVFKTLHQKPFKRDIYLYI